MESWQEFADYIYSEIEFQPFFKNNKPQINNLLTLANESLVGLTVDYLSFTNDNAISNASIIDIPNTCKEVFLIRIKDEEVERCNACTFDMYLNSDELVYKVGDYKVIFNKPIDCLAEELEIVGIGSFDLYTKDPDDKTVSELLPLEYHTMPAYFVLSRLFLRAKDFNMSQFYLQQYNLLLKDYKWLLTLRRTVPATFSPMNYTKTNTECAYTIYDKVVVEISSVPSLTPVEIDNRINTAVNTLASNVYTKSEVDSKDSTVLTNAQSYTYSKNQIDNKDTTNLTNAKAYTDTNVGSIEDALDDIIGE